MKEYLGDSVYIEHDGVGNFILTTNNVDGFPSNTIVMQLEVIEGFIRFTKKIFKEQFDKLIEKS